jgi:hypothetical protein
MSAINTSGHDACFQKTPLRDLTLAVREDEREIAEILKMQPSRPQRIALDVRQPGMVVHKEYLFYRGGIWGESSCKLRAWSGKKESWAGFGEMDSLIRRNM